MKDTVYIAIPSYGRPQFLADRTLRVLDRLGAVNVSIFVEQSQLELYRTALPERQVVWGDGPGVVKNRNAIARYYGPGAKVVCLDDDLEDLKIMGENGKWRPMTPEEFNTMLWTGFEELKLAGGGMWGISPLHNDYWARGLPAVHYGLPKVDGPFYGFVAGTPSIIVPEDSVPAFEDVERTLQVFDEGGTVVRLNRYVHWETRRSVGEARKNECAAVRDLERRYPKIVQHKYGKLATQSRCSPRPIPRTTVLDIADLPALRERVSARVRVPDEEIHE